MTSRPASLYLPYQSVTCGMARWQLMRGVGPEIDQDDLAAQLLEVESSVARCVEPVGDALDIRCGAAAFELRAAAGAVRQVLVLIVDQAAEVEFLRDLLRSADLVLQGAGVVGNDALQRGGQVEGDRDGEDEHHDAACDADLALAAAERADALGDPLACEGEHQQWQRSPDRERHGQDDGVGADGAGSASQHDGGEDRPGARHEQHAKGEAQPEPAAAFTGVELGDAGERLFQDLFELRDDQTDSDQGQGDDACPTDRVLRQVQQGQQCGSGQGDDAETQDQAGNHTVRARRVRDRRPFHDRGRGAATLRGDCRLRLAAGLCAGEEDDGQNGQDARRDAGDQAAEEADECKGQHDWYSEPTAPRISGRRRARAPAGRGRGPDTTA
ncbi:MAG: hypothetical protein QOC69_6128 [Mycobacterium sp.]|nr:hypothetical protein [Mycobacterium sp.]